MALELLVELKLDDADHLYSMVGVGTSGGFYEPRVLSLGDVVSEISALPGDFRSSETTIDFDNSDNHFSTLKAAEAIRNRVVNIKLGNLGVGLSDFQTIFSGLIRSWSMDRDTFSIEAFDPVSQRFDSPLNYRITPLLFPNLPDEAELRLIPLVMGNVSSVDGSNLGALPAYLVDPAIGQAKFRYLAAFGQIADVTNVYKYGVLQVSGFTTTTISGPGGNDVTVIDFTADPRDAARPNEREITWDGIGLTDDGTPTGISISNPVRQIRQLLLLNGFVAGDLDTNLIDAAAVDVGARGIISGFSEVDEGETLRDVLDKFAESFNLAVYLTPAGKVSISFPRIPPTVTSGLIEIDDQLHVGSRSATVESSEDVASTIDANWLRNWNLEAWEQTDTQTDTVQVGRLNEDVVRQVNMWYVRDLSTRRAVVEDRLFFLREERQVASFVVQPELLRDVKIGDDVLVTHTSGVAADGRGWRGAVFRVLGVGFRVERELVLLELRLVDLIEAVFAESNEWRAFLPLQLMWSNRLGTKLLAHGLPTIVPRPIPARLRDVSGPGLPLA